MNWLSCHKSFCWLIGPGSLTAQWKILCNKLFNSLLYLLLKIQTWMVMCQGGCLFYVIYFGNITKSLRSWKFLMSKVSPESSIIEILEIITLRWNELPKGDKYWCFKQKITENVLCCSTCTCCCLGHTGFRSYCTTRKMHDLIYWGACLWTQS